MSGIFSLQSRMSLGNYQDKNTSTLHLSESGRDEKNYPVVLVLWDVSILLLSLPVTYL